MEMTDLARKMCRDYTEVRPCCVDGAPDAHTVWLVVGGQQFCVTPIACDTLDEAQWMRGMLAKALDTAFRSIEAGLFTVPNA